MVFVLESRELASGFLQIHRFFFFFFYLDFRRDLVLNILEKFGCFSGCEEVSVKTSFSFRAFSTLLSAECKTGPRIIETFVRMEMESSSKTAQDQFQTPKGQTFDFINVAHSRLIHSDWAKLDLILNSHSFFFFSDFIN